MSTEIMENEFPQLEAALKKYIITDREDEMAARYRMYGEDDLEFAGLMAELEAVAKHPARAKPMFDAVYGADLDPDAIREACIMTANQLKGTGEFDKEKAPKVEGAELFDQYANRPFLWRGNPVVVRGWTVPLWAAFVASLGIFFIGYLLSIVLPSFLNAIPILFFLVGAAGALVTGAAISGLRSDIKDPAKAARRERMMNERREKGEQKKAGRMARLRDSMKF